MTINGKIDLCAYGLYNEVSRGERFGEVMGFKNREQRIFHNMILRGVLDRRTS